MLVSSEVDAVLTANVRRLFEDSVTAEAALAKVERKSNILFALRGVNGIMRLHVKFGTGTLEARQHPLR